MRRPLPLLLALALAACSARDIEEEPQSHRHLAAEWCEDWCTFWYDCEPFFDAHGLPVSGCQESCEADEWWDWTDECGTMKWELHECLESLTCEEALDDPDIPGTDNPCQPYFDDLVIHRCTYDRPHGG